MAGSIIVYPAPSIHVLVSGTGREAGMVDCSLDLGCADIIAEFAEDNDDGVFDL